MKIILAIIFLSTIGFISCQQQTLFDLLFSLAKKDQTLNNNQFNFQGFPTFAPFPAFKPITFSPFSSFKPSTFPPNPSQQQQQQPQKPSNNPNNSFQFQWQSNSNNTSSSSSSSSNNSSQQQQQQPSNQNNSFQFQWQSSSNNTLPPFKPFVTFAPLFPPLEPLKSDLLLESLPGRPKVLQNFNIQTYLDSLLKQFTTNINTQLQSSYQSIISQTLQDVLANIQQSAFNGRPFDVNSVVNNLVTKLQDTLLKIIPKALEDQFNKESAKIIDDQFEAVRTILKARLPFSLPIVDNAALNMKNKVKELVPVLTQLVSNEIVQVIKNQLKLN